MVYSMSNIGKNMIIMIVVRSASGSYYKKKEIVRILRNKQSLLEGAIGQRNYIVDYNPCNSSPCQHSGHCLDTIKVYNNETEVLDSPNFIFTTPKIRHHFVCKCPKGFTGERKVFFFLLAVT